MFEEFWAIYPRKEAKKDAFKAWMQLKETEKLLAVNAMPNHIKNWELKGTEIKFIPLPATWIRGWRWLDELNLEVKQVKNKTDKLNDSFSRIFGDRRDDPRDTDRRIEPRDTTLASITCELDSKDFH